MSYESIEARIECDDCGESDLFELLISGSSVRVEESFETEGWYARLGVDEHYCPRCAPTRKQRDGVADEVEEDDDDWDDDEIRIELADDDVFEFYDEDFE